ncbi:uncharacterized protein LOC106666573 isoform X1 [Cimex lectularius]|uniref:Shavenoid isoform B-like N-terminal domain-containing protein n=2 Tax=Cimex lectularius TaxID=79782 RepID=A0A8I6SL92_CIMLE|nr:uncharacterized protein LOC106666573 isoform X1 [Cimex lectularius]
MKYYFFVCFRTCNLKRMLFGLVGLLLLIGSSSCQSNSHITRQHPTDQFQLYGNCLEDACVEESSGTAELAGSCTCKCLPHLPVFREDLHICVDDIHECTLAPFVTGSTHQKVPYVFLPLKGQIIHPSSAIQFTDVTAPICVVSGAKYLTKNGWTELRNKSEAEPPFRLLKDEGKTYLQWLGESDLRLSMEGRLILIHLLCKDMDDIENQNNNIFTPCVSFRVAGTPSDTNAWTGVREVSFSVDSQNNNNGSIGSGYISVALCSVVIGLIYVASVVLYIQLRKKNTNQKEPSTPHIGVAEEGIVKNNPLLRHCHDNVLYLPESAHSCSDSDGSSDRIQLSDDSTCEPAVNVEVTSAVVHPCTISREKEKNTLSNIQSQDNIIEKHPEENVSIIETLDTREDKPEKICAIACSNVRRKLYFNPSFFQHELLLAPPPAAIEFLTKIREVISIAKSKMQAKRFSPSLLRIPEENENKSSDGETCNGSRLNQYVPSVNSNKLLSSDGLNSCRNCCKTPENKQRSVEKWLANVPVVSNEFGSADDTDEKASDLSEWVTDNNSLDKLRKSFFQQDDDVISSEENPSEFNVNYCNRKLLLYDNLTKKKGETMLKGDKTPDILYTIPIISTTEETGKNNNNQMTSSTSSFKNFTVNEVNQDEDNTTLSHSDSSLDKKPDEQTSQYELICNKNYEGEENGSELETMKFKGGFAVSCDYIDIQNTTGGIQSKDLNFPYYITNNPYTRNTRAMSEIHLNEKKDDHDYEMIMLNNIEETKSLPDFCSRPGGYSLISEVYVNSGFGFSSSQSSINSNNDSTYSPVGGKPVSVSKDGLEHLTINIKESPTNHTDEDSDNFEPDTLDRKPNNLVIPGDTTSKLQITNDFFTDSLERQAQISLKSTGSFRKDFSCIHSTAIPNRNRGVVLNRAFGSLREIFMAKNNYNQCTHRSSKPCSFTDVLNCTNPPNQISNLYWNREKYLKTLKPESKQAKRQRQPDPPNHSLISPPQPPDFMIDLPNESNVPALPTKSFKLNIHDDVHGCDRVSSLSCPFDLMCNKNHPIERANGANRHLSPIPKCQIEPRLNLRNFERFPNGVCHLGNIDNHCTGSELISGSIHLPDNLKINHSLPKVDKSANLSHQANLLLNRTEDSGYLSTDSNTSDKPLRRDGSLSETDDSFFDGASESGAESIATDSFFFGKTHQNSLDKPLETQS